MDLVFLQGHNSMQALTVTKGKIHQTKYGALPHADMIGRKFGTKVITLIRNIFVRTLTSYEHST